MIAVMLAFPSINKGSNVFYQYQGGEHSGIRIRRLEVREKGRGDRAGMR